MAVCTVRLRERREKDGKVVDKKILNGNKGTLRYDFFPQPKCLQERHYLQQEVEQKVQKLRFIIFLLLSLLINRRFKTCSKLSDKINDILHCRLSGVNDHGILQASDELLMEFGLIFQLHRIKNEDLEDCLS